MVKDRPLRDFLETVRSRKPLTYSSWGMHEWQVLFGERNGYIPRDGHFYFNGLCAEMTQLIQSRPAYTLGLPASIMPVWGERINAYLTGLGLDSLDWNTDVFHVESTDQVLDVMGTVSRVPMMVVGPPKLRRLRNLLRFRAFVDVPPRNQYLCVTEIVRNTLAALEDFKTPTLVSISAGVVSPLIVAALHRRVGSFHQLIDVGKLWEPLARR